MFYSYRGVMAWIAVLSGLSVVQLEALLWPEPCSIPMRPIGSSAPMSMDSDAHQIFVYRAFDLWSQMGPMYRTTVSVTPFMIPDEILWRIAVYWPDLGNHWHEASWRLHPVDDFRSASRATVLPPRINLPILQEFLKAFCRRGWPMVRCVGSYL